jgi:hypothetical protein
VFVREIYAVCFLRTIDLNVKTKHDCYLNHPIRLQNDEIDDVLLDSANQLEISRVDLITWVTSKRSHEFITYNPEPDVHDFLAEFTHYFVPDVRRAYG